MFESNRYVAVNLISEGQLSVRLKMQLDSTLHWLQWYALYLCGVEVAIGVKTLDSKILLELFKCEPTT